MKRAILAIFLLIAAQSTWALTGKLRCSFVGKSVSNSDLIDWIISGPNNDIPLGPYLELDLSEASKPEGIKNISKTLKHPDFKGYVWFGLSLKSNTEPARFVLSLEHREFLYYLNPTRNPFPIERSYGRIETEFSLPEQDQPINVLLTSTGGGLKWINTSCWVAEDT